METTAVLQTGQVVRVVSNRHFHNLPTGSIGTVAESHTDGMGELNYRVVVEGDRHTCSDMNGDRGDVPGQWVHGDDLLVVSRIPQDDSARGLRIRVADYASTDPGRTAENPGGFVATMFYGKEGVIHNYREEGRYLVTVDGHSNVIHGDYLTLIAPVPVLSDPPPVGTRFRVAEFASTQPGMTPADADTRGYLGYVDSSFFGKEVIFDQLPTEDDYHFEGCYRVHVDNPWNYNYIHKSYLTPVALPDGTPLSSPVPPAPVPDRSGEPLDQTAVELAVGEFKEKVRDIAIRHARGASINMYVVREALAEWGIIEEKKPSRRFRGTVTITVPFDVTIDDEDWEGDEDKARHYIQSSVNSYQQVTFDSDVTDNIDDTRYVGDSIDVSVEERVDEED